MSAATDGSMSIQRRLILLRWGFLAALAIVVMIAPVLLQIRLPRLPLFVVIALLALFNGIFCRRTCQQGAVVGSLVGQLCVDLVGLGVLLFFSGGAANPLVSMLLFPVAVAALSLPGRLVASITFLAIGIYSFLMVSFLPLDIENADRASSLHLIGMWLTFVISAGMAAWFMTRMKISIRARDAEIAAVREQALRDAQVLSLGQQAAGAAHELGTPLATMQIIVGDLLYDKRLPDDLRHDLDILGKQIQACKEIIGNMVGRSGLDRAGSPQRIPVKAWLEQLLHRWHTQWPHASCHLRTDTQSEGPMIAPEPVLEQAIANLLNNAARVDSGIITLVLSWDEASMTIAVCDKGPGFPEEVLRTAGAEPMLGKSKGYGIGLWLTRTAIERIGGRLILENQPDGAVAKLKLPVGGEMQER